MTFLTESADIARVHYANKLSLKQRSQFGQFLTPAPIARLIASQFNPMSGQIRLLDPGAGVGALTAAVVERLLANPQSVESCFITVYEVEASFLPPLQDCLDACRSALRQQGIPADYCLRHQSFIEASGDMALPLLSAAPAPFTHVVLNPPYKKINRQSIEKSVLSTLGIDTVNLYSAFIWLAMLQLAEGGEMAAITPRSFCNGPYFRPFRRAFLQAMALDQLHVFESRSAAFADDRVLQENIIFHAVKVKPKPDVVQITTNSGDDLQAISEIRMVPYSDVVQSGDAEQVIHIVTNPLEDGLRAQMATFSHSLGELGLEVSTGPVVDFRLKSALRHGLEEGTVPLLYPEAIKAGSVTFPPTNPRKPIAIEHTAATSKWLVQPGWYVVIKRFSAKEERRRIVAAVCPPMQAPALGIENHLNYYHARGKGLNPNLARGLAAFLNSTLFDHYFRHFSGHTQVNATDLRRIRYPSQEQLMQLGAAVGDAVFDQDQLDALVHNVLPIMSQATEAIAANKRIQEAIALLKSIGAPREQQNERSALCLLALADIRPETPWAQATTPRRRISEMMDWVRDYYGKQYAPTICETLRKGTMHQFVQMGLVVENPDPLDRPKNNSPSFYRLQQQAMLRLQA